MDYWKEIIDPGDRASALGKQVCFESHGNSKAVRIIPHEPGNFRGAVSFLYSREVLQQMLDHDLVADQITRWTMAQGVENDGAGGKPQFFGLIGEPAVFLGLGWEIIEMCAEDLARTGRFPTIMVNQIDAKRVTDKNFHLVEALFRGYGAALKKSRLVNITGEFAVMKHSITAFCDENSDAQLLLTWNAACLGLTHYDLLIRPEEIRPTMKVVGFWEPGYRCNGGSRFTELITMLWGRTLTEIKQHRSAMEFVRALTMPSQNYSRAITQLVGWTEQGLPARPLAKLFGIAHITGGGVWGKFREMLPEGIGANLHSMPSPAEVLLQAQDLSEKTNRPISDYEAYGTFHGGCGMLLVCPPKDTETVIKVAARYDIKAQVVGDTMASKNREVVIRSRFRQRKQLSSLTPE